METELYVQNQHPNGQNCYFNAYMLLCGSFIIRKDHLQSEAHLNSKSSISCHCTIWQAVV